MKKNVLIIASLLVAILIVASCKKDNNGGNAGIPSITKVTTSLAHSDDITNGALNQWVVIHGRNLSNVQQLSFDDLQVELKDIYATDTLISVRIPRRIPSEITNKITVVTMGGTTSYDFPIVLPVLKFSKLRNEYTAAGDTLDIEGENFDLYYDEENITVTFTGGATAPLTEFSPSKLRLVVPEDAQMGPITIKGGEPLNSEIVTNSSWYMDTRNMMILDPVLVPATGLVSSHPDFPNNPGPMLIKQDSYTAWGWDTFLSTYISYPADATGANVDNYVIKFEMNTKVPINKGDIIFRLGNGNYYRWPYNFYGVMINTNNQWETMTIPLKLVAMDPSDHAYVQLILSDGESRVNNYAITNFRIVPKN